MPVWSGSPVLKVDESRMLSIDLQNSEALLGMWSVFHKCTGFIEDGRRLENLSWRVFAHETLCSTPRKRQEAALPAPIPQPPHTTHDTAASQYSRSVDSVSSANTEDFDDSATDSAATPAATPAEESQISFGTSSTSWDRSRQGEKHITGRNLKNLITSIKVKQDLTRPLSPLPMSYSEPHLEREEYQVVEGSLASSAPTTSSAPTPRPSSPRPSSPRPVEKASLPRPRVAFERLISPTNASNASVESNESGTSIVRGFEPSAHRSQSQLALSLSRIHSASSSSPEAASALAKRKGGMFTLGGSMQESDSDHMRDNLSPMPPSSLRQPPSIRQASSIRQPGHAETKKSKHASFAANVTEMPAAKRNFILPSSQDEDAMETDDEDEDAIDDDESVIDEEDDDVWEDEEEDSAPQPLVFNRVESTANLTSRRSIITEGLHQGQRATGMQNAAFRSTPMLQTLRRSPRNGPSMPASPEDEPEEDYIPGIEDATAEDATSPMGITSTNMQATAPIAMSPRANRRNMLAQELGVSLRKHMLTERQQRNIFPAATLPRRHTTQDMQNLTQYPGASSSREASSSTNATNNTDGQAGRASNRDYFEFGLAEYHQKGW